MSTQKIHVKHLFIHLYCVFWVFFYLFFKKMTQVSLSRIWVVSMGSLSPNRSLWLYLSPLFYTCFHDAHLSLIVSYQFNLLNYVHYLFVCFLNIFMSKEIHKNESRLRLLQKKKKYLSNQTVYLWQRRKLHFHYFVLLDILNCLLSNIRF